MFSDGRCDRQHHSSKAFESLGVEQVTSLNLHQRQSPIQSQSTLQLQVQMIEQAHLLEMTIDELEEWIASLGDENPFLVVETNAGLGEAGKRTESSGRRQEPYVRGASRNERAQQSFQVSRSHLDHIVDSSDLESDTKESRIISLSDFLLEQLTKCDVRPEVRDLAENIISALDADGYFRRPVSVCAAHYCGAKLEHEALSLVQSLEPQGIAARSLAECLLLQLTNDVPFRYEARLILRNVELQHLFNSQNPTSEIKRITGLREDAIDAAMRIIGTLHANPVRAFNFGTVKSVRPFAAFVATDDQRIDVRLADDWFPKITLRHDCRQLLENPGLSKKEQSWVRKMKKRAEHLLDILEGRRKLALDVLTIIANHQRAFLCGEADFVEPLDRKRIAETLGRDQSMVCRIIYNRWIETPLGTRRLERFFSRPLPTRFGQEVSADWVLRQIGRIIDEEDKQSPFSDTEIQAQMMDLGVILARRTVSKYRTQLSIAHARDRCSS
jgi:RNA polymerase sigma-54 factor